MIRALTEIAGMDSAPDIRGKGTPHGELSRQWLDCSAIFEDLAKIGKGAGGEIQLTDAIARLMQREPIYSFEFEGKRYDCGSKLGYLQATVEFGLKHPSLGPEFADYLRGLIPKLSKETGS